MNQDPNQAAVSATASEPAAGSGRAQALLALVQRREIDPVLVTELSRWGRSTTDLLSAARPIRLRAGEQTEAIPQWLQRGDQADADLQAIVDAGRDNVPLTELRFRCSQCHTDRTDFVVTSRDNPQPW